MEGPRPWGTALWITVSPVPGKYALAWAGLRAPLPSPGDGARGTALTQRRPPFPAVWRSPAERRSPANPVLACKFQRFEHGAAALRPRVIGINSNTHRLGAQDMSVEKGEFILLIALVFSFRIAYLSLLAHHFMNGDFARATTVLCERGERLRYPGVKGAIPSHHLMMNTTKASNTRESQQHLLTR